MGAYNVTVGQTVHMKIQGHESDGSLGNPANPVNVTTGNPTYVSIAKSGDFNENVDITFLSPGADHSVEIDYSDGVESTSDTFAIAPAPVVEDGLVSIPQ